MNLRKYATFLTFINPILSFQSVMEYEEHEKRAWSVDFSRTEPSMLVSGSDDCKVLVTHESLFFLHLESFILVYDNEQILTWKLIKGKIQCLRQKSVIFVNHLILLEVIIIVNMGYKMIAIAFYFLICSSIGVRYSIFIGKKKKISCKAFSQIGL